MISPIQIARLIFKVILQLGLLSISSSAHRKNKDNYCRVFLLEKWHRKYCWGSGRCPFSHLISELHKRDWEILNPAGPRWCGFPKNTAPASQLWVVVVNRWPIHTFFILSTDWHGKKRKRVSHILREVAQATKIELEPQTVQLRHAAACPCILPDLCPLRWAAANCAHTHF